MSLCSIADAALTGAPEGRSKRTESLALEQGEPREVWQNAGDETAMSRLKLLNARQYVGRMTKMDTQSQNLPLSRTAQAAGFALRN
jgi:hypothetical protein